MRPRDAAHLWPSRVQFVGRATFGIRRAVTEDALATALRMPGFRAIAFALEGLAGALSLAGRDVEAVRLVAAATTVRRSHGLARGPAEREDIGRVLDRIRSALSEEAFQAELRHGATLSPADCLQAVADLPAPAPPFRDAVRRFGVPQST